MFTKIHKANRFSCFSAPVMLATFFIEIFLAFYILMKRKMNTKVRLAVLLLINLAIFQLAEYSICETFGVHPDTWARIGFTAITLLPPLGLHLVHEIAGKKNDLLVKGSYGAAIAWIGIFLFGSVMTGSVCEGNYVIFHISEPYETLYYWYYNFLMLWAMGLGFYYAKKSRSKNRKSALYTLVFAYASFIIPSIVFALIVDGNSAGRMPSILCGFAVIMAVILSLGVVPKVSKKK